MSETAGFGRALARARAAARVPAALLDRVEASFGPVRQIEEITGLRLSINGRGSFRAHLAGRWSVKLRCCFSERQAWELERLRRALADELPLSRILGREGRWLIEEWVEGAALAEPGTAAAAWAGDLLGRIHSAVPPEGVAPRRLATPAEAREEVESLLASLEAQGALTSTTAAQLRAGIALRAPEQLPLGITHTDLCPENVVRRPDATLVCVDQGAMTLGPIDVDLARLWYRWPMSETEREAFHWRYAEHRDASSFFASYWFHRVLVLARSAWLRLRGEPRRASQPLGLLRAMVERDPIRPRVSVPAAPAERVLRYDGLRLLLRADRVAPLEWLSEFLGHAFICEDEAAEREIEVELEHRSDGGLPRATGEEIDCFTMDSRFERYARCASAPDQIVACDEQSGALLRISAAGVKLRLARDDRKTRLAVLRVLRELATFQSLGRGRLLLHAAAVAAGDRGITFAGQRCAGKTSNLLNALRHANTSYLTNDRAVLAPDDLTLWGLATSVALRVESLRFFPGLLERYGDPGFESHRTLEELAATREMVPRARRFPTDLSPSQLCRWLDVPAVPRAPLSLLVFPEVAPEVATFTLARLAPVEAAARLYGALFPAAAPGPGAAAFEPLWPEARLRSGTPELCEAVARRVPALACRLGRRAFAPESNLWRAILEHLDQPSSRRFTKNSAIAR